MSDDDDDDDDGQQPDLFHDGWSPEYNPDSAAFAGLSDDTLKAIQDKVPYDQVLALVGALPTTPALHAEEVRKALVQHPGFPVTVTRDTQLRRIRTIRDAAIAFKFPVCTTNAGYWLGTADDVLESASRARRYASGAYERAVLLEMLAKQLPKRPS